MFSRLVTQLTEQNLPENQCSFRKNTSTTDMIFCLRQLQEKTREQNVDLFVVFVYLTKTFDTVNRHLLWDILEKMRVSPKYLTVLKQLHDGIQTQV